MARAVAATGRRLARLLETSGPGFAAAGSPEPIRAILERIDRSARPPRLPSSPKRPILL